MGTWTELVKFITDGEQVKAGVANRAPRTIDANVRFLRDLLEAMASSQAIFARDVTVEASVVVGTPVYYRASTQQFEKALAVVDGGNGDVQLADSADCWGIVYSKTNATLADVCLFGVLEDFDLSAVVDGDVEAGQYYLSGTQAGMLVQQSPPVSVPLLRADGNGMVFVNPQVQNLLDAHSHHLVELVALPAGTHVPPLVGERHEITAADVTIEGWLPADHASFNGTAPDGAVFGYNIAESSFRDQWPPIPFTNSYLEIDRGLDAEQGFHGVPLGPTGLAVVDRNGIWWMSDCYGDVPWPTELNTTVSDSSSSSSSSSAPECPRSMDMRIQLWFTQFRFFTDTTVVTSLTSIDDRIEIVCLLDQTQTGSKGDLAIRLNLSFALATATNTSGSIVLKGLDSDGKFTRGPIVEGLVASGANVQLSGTSQQVVGPNTVHQGIVTVTVDPLSTFELPITLVRLDGVTTEFFQEVMYLQFPAAQNTSLRGQLHIPGDLEMVDPQLSLRLRIIGRDSGTLPPLTLTMRRVPRPPDGLDDPLSLPTSDTAVSITTVATVASNEYVEAVSADFAVEAGDTLFFSISRADSDGYAGRVGILQQIGVLTPGS